MKSFGTTAAVLSAALVFTGSRPTAAEPPAVAPQARRQAQERARAMARELVSGVLDVQLAKLKANGLDKLPLYGEIALMREHIDRLIETDMAEVIELLAQAETLPEEAQLKQHAVIREKTRGIVARLAAERRALMRRMKLADLAAQVRRLIDLQTKVLGQTSALSADQPAPIVATIQDERDLKSLYAQLENLLGAVSSWGGAEGAAGADGLHILKAARVSERIDGAITALEAVRFEESATGQKAVIRGLSALLEKVEEARGLAGNDVEGLLKEIAQLAKRQEDLKQKAKVENLPAKEAEQLLEDQSKLHKDLDQLDEAVKRFPGAAPLLQKAKAAAYEATSDLFAAKSAEATQEQDKVLTNLAALGEQVKAAAANANAARSADDLARLSAHLKNAQTALKESEPFQRNAFAKESDGKVAKDNLEEVGKKLAQARGEPKLPPQVAIRLNEAAEATERATKTNTPGSRDEAKAAVERATAEVNAAVAETERRQLAVKIGELGRAAEALERAAAHQRDLSEKAAQVAPKAGFTAAEAKTLHAEQQEVAKIAEGTTEGVKNTAPKAAETLAAAKQRIRNVETELANARQTPKEAGTVAKEAKQAATNLEAAAAQLRSEIRDTAQALTQVADRQLTELGDVAKDVDRLRAQQPPADKDPIETLAKAKKMIADARTEQLRAMGREKAVEQRELARKITDLLVQQDRAERSAKDLTDGVIARAGDAVVAQQQAANQAGTLARDTKGSVGEELSKAEKAAAKAAQQLLDGKPRQAEAARAEARAALEKANRLAREQAEKAANDTSGRPSAPAQKRVGDLSREAARLAQSESPEAGSHLDSAGEQSKEAEKRLGAGENAQDAQKKADDALRTAEQQIDQAMGALAKRQLDQKEADGKRITGAADKSARVDTDALSALRGAEKNARTKEDATSPDGAVRTPKTVQEMRSNIERAANALDTRKARVERDKALAEDVGRDATRQQQARDRIEANARELGKTSDTDKPKPTDREAKAADELGRAVDEFGETLQRIGENAREISQQDDVANPQLQKAIEAASKLTKPQTGPGETTPDVNSGTQGGDKPQPGADSGRPDTETGRNGNANRGTGLVPEAPGQTARMVAGSHAITRANQVRPGTGHSSASGSATQANPSGKNTTPSRNGAVSNGAPAANGNPNGSAPGRKGEDTTATAKPSREQPWMTKLPPDVRKGIGANTRQAPPRGYEDLLRRYFQGNE